MLFQLRPDTPRFLVFQNLNDELIQFLENSIPDGAFRRTLLTTGPIGQACWDNSKENNPSARNDLTREKFEGLFNEIQRMNGTDRRRLHQTIIDTQDISALYSNTHQISLSFLPSSCLVSLGRLTSHLFCATKDLQGVIMESGNININQHFHIFSQFNGNVCSACGMDVYSRTRANTPAEEQWRPDYDHQLCQSKYPAFAIHPDNLIPLCDTCNRHAKRSKDILKCSSGRNRKVFFPYSECAKDFIELNIEGLDDPEMQVSLVWNSTDQEDLEKIEAWDEIYDIRAQVESTFRCLDKVLLTEIQPENVNDLTAQISREARAPNSEKLKRKPWAFWNSILFQKLDQIELSPLYAKVEFTSIQGREGGDYILSESNNPNPPRGRVLDI